MINLINHPNITVKRDIQHGQYVATDVTKPNFSYYLAAKTEGAAYHEVLTCINNGVLFPLLT